jgi:hypothetical protein
MTWRALLTTALLAPPSLPAEAHATPTPPAPWADLELPESLAALLDTGKWDATPKGFRIASLSFLADGCVAQSEREPSKRSAALACVQRAIALAQSTRPKSRRADPSDDGFWLSHYNLMLGARDRLIACPNPAEHERIALALARRALREPTHHDPSFPGVAYRWPADQAATLASLARFDRAHGRSLADEPIRLWRTYVLAHAMDKGLGLPWSEATGKAPGARAPRGCALSWQTRYLHEFDDPLALLWWAQYKRHYLVAQLGLVGFREWPVGRERPADSDSGPIVQGVGTAASALAIAAARTMGDEELAARLESIASIVGTIGSLDSDVARHAHSVLAASIRYIGAQSRRLPRNDQNP